MTMTVTRLTRDQTFLGILVVLRLEDPSDGATVELEPHLVRDAQHHLVVVEAGDRPVHPARRDDAVATLEGGELLLLLRADQEEPEDREDRGEEQELREDGGGPASARRRRGREGEVTGVSGAKHPRIILHNARKTEP